MDEIAARVLRSGRGLAVLVALTGGCPRSPFPIDSRPLPDGPVRSDDLRDALSVVAGMAWWSDRVDVRDRLLAAGPNLAAAAAELVEPAWFSDLDRSNQVILGAADEPPDLRALCDEQWVLATRWVPERLAAALITGTRRDNGTIPLLWAGEHRDVLPDPVGVWGVDVEPGARVYEVHVPEDWAALCARRPRVVRTTETLREWGVTSSEVVIPDWGSVVEEIDAVHVSLGGALAAVGVPVAVGDRQSVLEDVDSEVTAWFRPLLRVGERLMTVDREDLPD